MSKFIFDPPNGLLDKNVFPSKPQTEDAARGQFMQLFNQVKEHMNSNMVLPEDIEFNIDDRYVKFKNGFLVHWGEGAINNSNYSADLQFSFKVVFSNTPIVILGLRDANTSMSITARDVKASGFLARVTATVPSGGSGIGVGAVVTTFVALGRWK